MLGLAVDLKYIDQNKYSELEKLSLEISRILSGFIKTL